MRIFFSIGFDVILSCKKKITIRVGEAFNFHEYFISIDVKIIFFHVDAI
jgi:hypothetical protein